MPWTIDVRVVAFLRFVLDVGRRNGDSALSLFGCFIDTAILEKLGKAFLGLSFRDSCRQGSLCYIVSITSRMPVTVRMQSGTFP